MAPGIPLLPCPPFFVPVCSVRLRSRNPHPVPGAGNPTISIQKRNLREGAGLFTPLCANPGDGRTLLRKCRDAIRRAPRASPGREAPPGFRAAPGTWNPAPSPPPSPFLPALPEGSRGRLPGAGSAPASVRAAPPAAACCRSHLRGRAAPPEPRAPRGYIAPRGRERRVPRSALRPGPRDDRGALSSCGRNGGESRRSRRSRSRRSRRRRSRRRRGRGAERRRRAEGGGRKAGRKL